MRRKSGDTGRAAVKRLLLSEPGLSNEAILERLKSKEIDLKKRSISNFRWDFGITMRALQDLGVIEDNFANWTDPASPGRQGPKWLHRFNQILFREPCLDREALRARLAKEELPPGEEDLSSSRSASLESFDILYEYRAILRGDAATDIEDIIKDIVRPTVRAALIDARLGQGQFRAALLERWQNACAVTGCTVLETLRASHMKPWRESNNAERLNPENGVLLSAHLDALFDKYLISFNDDGDMLVSTRINADDRQLLGIPQRLQKALSGEERAFLILHLSKFQS
jgi:hypothetical protein